MIADSPAGRASGPESADGAAASSGDWALAPPPLDLCDQPIAFMYADHQRQRRAADLLSRIAGGDPDPAGAKRLIDFFSRDLPDHVADEENELFPLLRAHSLDEDDIEAMLARLAAEHEDGLARLRTIVSDLNRVTAGEPFDAAAGERMREFASALRRHLAFENAALLPLAEVRLNRRAMAAWIRTLKARHMPTAPARPRRR